MSIVIKVNSVDKSSLINWSSVKKTSVLTKEPDTLEFEIKNYPTKTYLPSLGDTVEMYDTFTTLDSFSETNRDGFYDLRTTTRDVGQAFTNTNAIVLDSCKFYLHRVGTPTGTATAKLYAMTGSLGTTGKPTGAALATSTAVDISAVTTTGFELITFTFPTASRITLAASTNYCIILSGASITGDASNRITIGYDTTSPSHTGNLSYSADASTWTAESGKDVCFYIYGSNIIFGGTAVEVDNKIEGLLSFNRIVCKDWQHTADQLLVSATFTSQTATAIAQSIISTYCSGFTSVNVSAPITIDSLVFNYLTVSAALEKLIKATGGDYDYYFDYNKDLHFFVSGYYPAPFTLTDSSQNFDFQSLVVNDDLSQLKNKITVRGGVTTGTQVTSLQVADGKQTIFFVGYSFSTITVSKALAASPTSFVAQTVGADGKDDPASFNCLYNPDTGLLIFTAAPAINDVVKFIGTPSFPVIVQLHDTASIASYGTYEALIVDKTIVSKTVARNRATAELIKYKDPLVLGSFRTRTSGLLIGQSLIIDSTTRGISEVFKIQRITTSLRTPSASTEDFNFDIEFISTQNLTMNDILKKLLVTNVTDQVVVGQNEIVDTVYSQDETVTAGEVVATSLTHNAQAETVTAGEVNTVQALNYAVVFVLGITAPSGTSRQFILGGSRLS